jgi:hypothetical protein
MARLLYPEYRVGLAPKLIQLIVFPFKGGENVHDYVTVVQ